MRVEGKTWWDMGVVRESINRKRKITLSLDSGPGAGKYIATGPSVLSLRQKPQKVGGVCGL